LAFSLGRREVALETTLFCKETTAGSVEVPPVRLVTMRAPTVAGSSASARLADAVPRASARRKAKRVDGPTLIAPPIGSVRGRSVRSQELPGHDDKRQAPRSPNGLPSASASTQMRAPGAIFHRDS
jgi:hypothetical protein